MNRAKAIIVNPNIEARKAVAAGGRISTQSGTAMQIYAKSGDTDKDLKLISKVLSSGHKTILEHQTMNIVFEDVSVFTEQFMIEFRLASFTVKSRRYVDFSDAGYVMPEFSREEDLATYKAYMEKLFSIYTKLLDMGIPKEDARFVLPYSLRSNFVVTVNARELVYMISVMCAGRGSNYPELRMLGASLKEQFDTIYPGVIDHEIKRTQKETASTVSIASTVGDITIPSAELLQLTHEPCKLLSEILGKRELSRKNLCDIISTPRPRALEAITATFRISGITLACLTHFTRHRIQSLVIPSVDTVLEKRNYILPESVSRNPEATELYKEAFADCPNITEAKCYCALSGHVIDIILTMNARELLHFMQLRTCTRAQWEIRAVAKDMLLQLRKESPDLFDWYGPSCAILGYCPEGKMSCGNPVKRSEI